MVETSSGWPGILNAAIKVRSLILIFGFIPMVAHAQNLSVSTLSFDDYYRRSQLLGDTDSTISFTVRPLSLSAINASDSVSSRLHSIIYESPLGKSNIQIFPFLWEQRYNGNPSNSYGDGLMIPAKGYQTIITGGAFLKFGPIKLQLRPEFIFAQNKDYEVQPYHYGFIDLPSRFGNKSYSQLDWGQSSIRLDFDVLSIGLSNENLWWGPGIQNALLMSNSAAGFKHLTLNTNRPVRTPVGSFEAQIVAGRLEGSGFNSSLPEDWRYLSGLVLSFQPRWIPGLFFGLTRSFQMYKSDMDGSFGDVFPFLQAFQKVNTSEDTKRRDQLTSVFTRWLIPIAKSELYFEYGLNDHSYNIRDFLMAPEHSRSYLFGMKKLVSYKKRKDEFLEFSAEITRLEQSIDRIIRPAGEWYAHSQVLHGYTHRGEILGSGIGPGGNLQSVKSSWVKGLKQIGLQLERYEHNGDLANLYGYSPWLDFSVSTYATWTFEDFLVSGKFSGIQSVNYQWKDGISGRIKRNVFNVNAQVGIMYNF